MYFLLKMVIFQCHLSFQGISPTAIGPPSIPRVFPPISQREPTQVEDGNLPCRSWPMCRREILSVLSKVVWNTPLEHTPSNLYQQAISRDSFHNWRTGDCQGCAISGCVYHFLGYLSLNPCDLHDLGMSNKSLHRLGT